MSHPMRLLVALALLTGLAVAAPVPKAKKKSDDAEVILGSWLPVDGRTECFEFLADGGLKAWNTGSGRGNTSPYTWTLDPTATPKRMTWGSSGNGKPQWECVYELDGDTLRINYVSAGSAVPSEVGPTNKSGFFCNLRRETPK